MTPLRPPPVDPTAASSSSPKPTGWTDPALAGQVWAADRIADAVRPVLASGHEALDAQLPGGGWPVGALTELLLDQPGHGEWRLLGPLLAGLARSGGRWVAIAPPLRPHGPALRALGLDLAQGLWIDVASDADAAWAAEQALRSVERAGVAASPAAPADSARTAVLWWSDERTAALSTGTLRRLHLAVQASEALLFVLRPVARAGRSTPAPLRLQAGVDPEQPTRLRLRILKRRGPPLEAPLLLDTGPQFAAALAHRLSQPLPQHRALPTAPPTVPTAPAAARRRLPGTPDLLAEG
ncbi:translesion DNA synthesis-associated protein ImuA [Leptothrix discophora]|uniref:Translesion DNA synthesis-associated protein ImuA n=1 Tax=Leptothrix discophora TaxID=89 RepID=A0ABT9G0V5_LEPDI|nr:translesion DNA synthesis-associated protein ImuA [Leptothrix discophora]MDP4300102.1 translesion DNA synthesis-associated protein ImuA [Leptothrix discophora]